MPETRRQQIDALLKESELLAEIFDSIHDGIMVVGEDEIIAYTNPVAEKLLGLSHNRLIGVRAEEIPLAMYFRDGEKMQQQSRPFAAALKDETQKGATQVILKRVDGSTLPMLFNVRKKGNNLTVAILTDHSEMMRRQQQQDDHYRLLAHDIRTPLTAILGHADLLKSNGEESRSVDAIREAGKQLEKMTEEMSDRMELESGHFRLKKEEVRLDSVIEEVVSQLNFDHSKYHVDVQTESLPVIRADLYRLKRVLINLITNALKYSSEGATIEITAWENAKGVMIKVSDQGRGIESGDLNYIFDPFYIASLGKENGGVGLGLYISRLIVEAHDGRIYVSSTEEGTSFAIFLPKLDDFGSESCTTDFPKDMELSTESYIL